MNPGSLLGPYRVESLLGAGGMGEVYLGVDTRLDRQVAIKILPDLLARDPSLRERFEREARTISSLSHPNICTLFDIGRENGSDFLVMEYLQGETLADKIARGPMTPQQVVKMGIEIANALAAAHREGVIHRDLKPGNIMVTRSGIKLLDFGLAKLSVAAQQSMNSGTSMLTEQKPLTEQGTILGTFQYMSPEQLEGKDADPRSDIFALGAILYEMATGRRAFDGTSKASVIAAIMDRDPTPLHEVQPFTPLGLERVVNACLAKDPADRVQTAHDVALDLKWVSESSSVIEPVSVRRRRQILPWAAAALGLALAMVAGGLLWRETQKPPAPYSLSIVPPRGLSFSSAALSPDGTMLAFVAFATSEDKLSLWVRRIDDGSMKKIVDDVAGNVPFWSPDSKWIGYMHVSQKMVRVRAEGGQSETICRTNLQGKAAWSDDGTVLFTPRFGSGLSRVPATGGEPVVVTKLDPKLRETFHGQPWFLDGKRFLYMVHTVAEKRNEVWVGSLENAGRQKVMDADALVGYSKPYLLFVRDGAIFAQRFNPSKLLVSGEPQRVADNVQFAETEVLAATMLSQSGALAYVPYQPTPRLVNVYDRKGMLVSTLWKQDDITVPRLSPDGSTLIVEKRDPAKGATDIHAVDLARGIATRLTGGLAAYRSPAISPDGQSIAYFSDAGGMYDIYVRSIDGSGEERKLWLTDRDKGVCSWSPDGKAIVATQFEETRRNDLWMVPLDPKERPRILLSTEYSESSAMFSPDQKAFAYVSTQTGTSEVYVKPYPNGRAVRVSSDGGGTPEWTRDGREVIWTSKNRVMSATVDLSGPVPQVSSPKVLFTLPQLWSRAVPMKDGNILFIVTDTDAETIEPIELTTAWRMRLAKQ
jgi:eukaryotic-like serine/threonine-protein kinase